MLFYIYIPLLRIFLSFVHSFRCGIMFRAHLFAARAIERMSDSKRLLPITYGTYQTKRASGNIWAKIQHRPNVNVEHTRTDRQKCAREHIRWHAGKHSIREIGWNEINIPMAINSFASNGLFRSFAAGSFLYNLWTQIRHTLGSGGTCVFFPLLLPHCMTRASVGIVNGQMKKENQKIP